jgi:outer membrane beta-barrel protein
MKRLLLQVLSFGIALPTLAGENDLYDFLWLDPDKKVYVLQNKIYPKDGTYYVDLSYLNNITNEFQTINGAGIKVGYYWAEEWAIEFQHLTYSSQNNTAYDSVRVVNEAEPFIRRPLSSTSVFAIWSPFYGKINTFNKIIYFDWYFGVGTGQFTAESNLDSVVDGQSKSTYKTESYTPLHLKTGLKVHINSNLHFGVELLNTNFQAGSAKNPKNKSFKLNNDLIFSLGVSF